MGEGAVTLIHVNFFEGHNSAHNMALLGRGVLGERSCSGGAEV